MSTPILATKLYIPPPRPKAVLRPHLIERLDEGLHRKLPLISAPAGFGKTTLVSTWNYDSRFTVKGHNLRIFGKLQVQRRTEAVARARALGSRSHLRCDNGGNSTRASGQDHGVEQACRTGDATYGVFTAFSRLECLGANRS